MNRTEFQELMGEYYDQLVALNTTKGHDYAGDDDALSNFKDMAVAAGQTPLVIWQVYAGKHWSAIMTYCREGKVQSEAIEGRVLDLILYGFLLLGLIKEKKQHEELLRQAEVNTLGEMGGDPVG